MIFELKRKNIAHRLNIIILNHEQNYREQIFFFISFFRTNFFLSNQTSTTSKKKITFQKKIRSVLWTDESFWNNVLNSNNSKTSKKFSNKSRSVQFEFIQKNENIFERKNRSSFNFFNIIQQMTSQFTNTDASIISKSSEKNAMSNMNQTTIQMFRQMIDETVKNVIDDCQKKQKIFESLNSSKLDENQKFSEIFGNETKKNQWNSKNIEFFDLNYEGKFAQTKNLIIHSEKNTYYKNVHVFIERIKKMIIILKTKQIRRNLSTCLKKTVLMWHTAEFADFTRRLLIYDEGVKKWKKILLVRFKSMTAIVQNQFLYQRYLMKNARKYRKFRKYVQKIIRLVKSTEMNSKFNQFNCIYNNIDAKLRRNLHKSTKNTKINNYFIELDACKKIWWKLIRNKSNQTNKWQFQNKFKYNNYDYNNQNESNQYYENNRDYANNNYDNNKISYDQFQHQYNTSFSEKYYESIYSRQYFKYQRSYQYVSKKFWNQFQIFFFSVSSTICTNFDNIVTVFK